MYPVSNGGMTILTLVVSFLGGGVVSAVIGWIRANRVDKRERRIKFLDDQIRKLYGPLYYFTSQNEKLFALNKRFHKAYDKEYIQKKYSREESTQRMLRVETQETIDIANEYMREVEKNNERIKQILDDNYSYIDPEDIDIFLDFFEDYIRLKKERDKEKRIRTPFMIYQHIGDISFMKPELIEKAKLKFSQKKENLDKLMK